MALYALQKAIYAYLNPRSDAGPRHLDAEALRAQGSLADDELRALVDADVKALYRLGVHPVLLNSYARARVPRDEYRTALAELDAERTGA